MKKVISWLKNIRPVKLIATCLAVSILFFTQACNSGGATATAPKSTDEFEPARQTVGIQKARPNAEVYAPKGEDTLSPVEGGMNNFSDVDPRTQGADVKAKAEALKDNAERNVIDETANIGETTRRILDKKGDNVEQIGKNLQRSAEFTKDRAQDTAEDLVQGTKKGLGNIQENTKDAAEGATSNAQGAVEDAKLNAKSAVRDADANVSDVKDAGKNFFQSKVDEVTTSAQRNLDKASSAVKDAVDDD